MKNDFSIKKPIINNRSSYRNIPDNLKILGEEIAAIAEVVYQDIIAINWHGSIPRGDFAPGESDADITIFIKNDFQDGHRDKRETMLDAIRSKWEDRGIVKLDVIAVPESQLHEDFRRNALFFCESDGIYLPNFGELDLKFTIPKTNLELVTLLNRYFQLWITDAKAGIPELTEKQVYNQVWKRTYRAIYALAILGGAPYEQNWRLYPDLIQKKTPQHFGLIMPLMQKDIALNEIIKIAEEVSGLLKTKGLVFQSSWAN